MLFVPRFVTYLSCVFLRPPLRFSAVLLAVFCGYRMIVASWYFAYNVHNKVTFAYLVRIVLPVRLPVFMLTFVASLYD